MKSYNILLLGATGPCGVAFIREALSSSDPPKLTLYVRDAGKVPPSLATPTQVLTGQLSDETALSNAMADVDVVISFLGPTPTWKAFLTRSNATPIADSFPTILRAMQKNNVNRILALSTAKFSLTPEHNRPLPFSIALFFVTLFLPGVCAEMRAIGQTVSANNNVEWTVFRVPRLTNRDPVKTHLGVCAGALDSDYPGDMSLSRIGLARWVLKEVHDRRWIRGDPQLGNCKL